MVIISSPLKLLSPHPFDYFPRLRRWCFPETRFWKWILESKAKYQMWVLCPELVDTKVCHCSRKWYQPKLGPRDPYIPNRAIITRHESDQEQNLLGTCIVITTSAQLGLYYEMFPGCQVTFLTRVLKKMKINFSLWARQD